MEKNQPCILIYNPISGHGHLDSWNAMFIASLLERGWRVLSLTPDVSALQSRLIHRGLAGSERLQILEWDAERSRFYRFARGALRRWADDSGPLASAFRFLYRLYRWLCEPGTAHASDDTGRDTTCPVNMARRVRAALRRAKWAPRLAFNMYMDTYRTNESRWRAFDAINTLPWAGILFSPSIVPQGVWYSLKTWRGMCFLDEDICRIYASALPNKRFGYLPDITDTGLPDRPGNLVHEIRRRAGGRKIVFLGGSIVGKKNLERWYELIAMADTGKWFFVQVGEIHRSTLSAGDRAALDRAIGAPVDNLFLWPEYLPDDRAFNEVIAACDVIFAVYRNVKSSSNMVSKAAHFRKPILVSDRHIMGERVMRFGIGCAVNEESTVAMLDGLAAIVRNPVPEENFSRYHKEFGPENTAARLDSFLINCLQTEVT